MNLSPDRLRAIADLANDLQYAARRPDGLDLSVLYLVDPETGDKVAIRFDSTREPYVIGAGE